MTDYRLWPATSGPASATTDSSVNLGTEFYVTSSGLYAKAILFWRPTTAVAGTILGRIWQVVTGTTGTAVAGTDVTFTLSGTGWQQANLTGLVALTANQRYRVACLFPTNYGATGGYWVAAGGGAAGISNGPLTAPPAATATGGIQGGYDYSAGYSYPANAFNGGNYWVDVLVTNGATAPAPPRPRRAPIPVMRAASF